MSVPVAAAMTVATVAAAAAAEPDTGPKAVAGFADGAAADS